MQRNCFFPALLSVMFICAPASAQVTQRQASYVDGLFRRYDANSDGILDAGEIAKMSRSIKLLDGDSNGNGEIDRQEALNFVSGARPKNVPAPAIDGVFDEWTQEDVLRNESVLRGVFIKSLSAKTEGTKIFFSVEFTKPQNLQGGEPGRHPFTLDFEFGMDPESEEMSLLELSFHERYANFYEATPMGRTGAPKRIPWSELAFVGLPTFSSDRFEFQIDLASLGGRKGERVLFDFGEFNLKAGEADRVHVSYDRPKESDFRVANLNTLQNGLADTERGPAIGRLMAAAKADIYCFQEEWEEPLFNKGIERFHSNSVWFGGCAILTSLPLERIPMTLDRAVAGLVTLPNKEYVAVISAHFKCCGYAGSPEDDLRIQQAEQLVDEIKKMRDGAFGEKAELAPVVVIGNYNLVGSRMPLDKLNEAGLLDVMMRNPADGTAYTWRGLKHDESFWPGRWDLLTHTEALVEPLNGLVLDSQRMTAKQRRDLGLNENDSLASDHLMLITDFRIADVGYGPDRRTDLENRKLERLEKQAQDDLQKIIGEWVLEWHIDKGERKKASGPSLRVTDDHQVHIRRVDHTEIPKHLKEKALKPWRIIGFSMKTKAFEIEKLCLVPSSEDWFLRKSWLAVDDDQLKVVVGSDMTELSDSAEVNTQNSVYLYRRKKD